jgi:hypothetical protein
MRRLSATIPDSISSELRSSLKWQISNGFNERGMIMGDSTKTIMPLGAAAQADNEPGRWDYIRPDQYDKPIAAKVSAAEIKALGLVIGLIAPGLLLLLAAVQGVSCWGQSYDLSTGCKLASGLLWGYITCGVLLALGSAIVLLWGRVARVRVETARAAITRDPYSNPVSVWEVQRRTVDHNAAFFSQRQAAEIAMAPHKLYPAGLDALSISSPTAKAEPAAALSLTDSTMPALVLDTEWLTWLAEQPHTMIAGGTGTGKTTLARVGMIERLSLGYAGIVVDPKGKEWFGLPVIGGGRKFDLILATLDSIRAEMGHRFEAYGAGERSFQPIAVLVDEVPDIMDACLDDRRRLVNGSWSRFARQLGSLAREIGISVHLMTQSPLVEDIGMNSSMRKNFSRVALGDEAPLLIREERDPKRRAALQDLLRGQQYPAAMMRRGQVHLLDTSNVPSLAARSIKQPLGWTPTPTTQIESAIEYPSWVKSTNGKIAYLLNSGWSYREIAPELHVSHDTISDVSKALQQRAAERNKIYTS